MAKRVDQCNPLFQCSAGYLGAGERRRAICWAVLGMVEVLAIVL